MTKYLSLVLKQTPLPTSFVRMIVIQTNQVLPQTQRVYLPARIQAQKKDIYWSLQQRK